MYYLLTQELDRLVEKEKNDGNDGDDKETKRTNRLNNTFILALDGDVDFQPSALALLIDRMKKNDNVGAACGRIHPIGQGKQ